MLYQSLLLTGTNEVRYHYLNNNLLLDGEAMKIAAKDIAMLQEYLERELVEQVNVTTVDKNFAVHFDFADAENRECTVICYDVLIDRQPDLIKKMQLQTRTKKETT